MEYSIGEDRMSLGGRKNGRDRMRYVRIRKKIESADLVLHLCVTHEE
jgi:hypothetical protein